MSLYQIKKNNGIKLKPNQPIFETNESQPYFFA